MRWLIGVTGMVAMACAMAAEPGFEQWQRQQQQALDSYLSEQDKAFLSHLDKEWQAFARFQGEVRDPTPKPVRLPTAPVAPEPQPQIALPPVSPVLPAPVPRPEPAQSPMPPAVDAVTVAFFGANVPLPRLPAIAAVKPNQEGIKEYWAHAASTHSGPVVEGLRNFRETGNDWSLLQLVYLYSVALYPASTDQQAVTQWFLLTRLGYQSRVALVGGRIQLFLPFKQVIYGHPYIKHQGQRHYLGLLNHAKLQGDIYTYEGDYPDATRILDLDAAAVQLAVAQWKSRDLRFGFSGKTYTLSVPYDVNRIRFLETYPLTEFDLYFHFPPAARTAEAFVAQLRPWVAKMDEKVAVNFLLRLAQTAFEYKTDRENFGFENYLFVDEVLYNAYSDCEDRAILFAWLVGSLLGMEVVGLEYPGHVAIAVRFQAPLTTGVVQWEGRTFNVADPTYIGANAGMVMPDFVNETPKVIPIRR